MGTTSAAGSSRRGTSTATKTKAAVVGASVGVTVAVTASMQAASAKSVETTQAVLAVGSVATTAPTPSSMAPNQPAASLPTQPVQPVQPVQVVRVVVQRVVETSPYGSAGNVMTTGEPAPVDAGASDTGYITGDQSSSPAIAADPGQTSVGPAETDRAPNQSTSDQPAANQSASGTQRRNCLVRIGIAEQMSDAHFRAMGCEAHVIINGPAHLLEFAEARIAQLEIRWSRFIESSEVSELNRAQGRPVFVSMDTVELLERSWDGRSVGLGWFEPFQLGAIERAGYLQSYENLPSARRLPSESIGDMGRRSELIAESISGALATIEFGAVADPRTGGRLVSLPDGLRLDPGGLGKGLAADIVTREVMERGAQGALVNLGGDLRARGTAGGPSAAWPVIIAHPISGATIASVHLHDAAIATSSTLLRTWRHCGQPVHHIIDPHTAEPLPQPPGCITVASAIAAEGWMAEALATAALCAGGPIDSADGWTVTVDDVGVVAYGGRLPGGASTVIEEGEVGADRIGPSRETAAVPAQPQGGNS